MVAVSSSEMFRLDSETAPVAEAAGASVAVGLAVMNVKRPPVAEELEVATAGEATEVTEELEPRIDDAALADAAADAEAGPSTPEGIDAAEAVTGLGETDATLDGRSTTEEALAITDEATAALALGVLSRIVVGAGATAEEVPAAWLTAEAEPLTDGMPDALTRMPVAETDAAENDATVAEAAGSTVESASKPLAEAEAEGIAPVPVTKRVETTVTNWVTVVWPVTAESEVLAAVTETDAVGLVLTMEAEVVELTVEMEDTATLPAAEVDAVALAIAPEISERMSSDDSAFDATALALAAVEKGVDVTADAGTVVKPMTETCLLPGATKTGLLLYA
jgi:hypothetical protein